MNTDSALAKEYWNDSPPKNYMHTETDDLPPPVNHVFVDYENVHAIDAAIIGRKTVQLTLLLGAQKTKLDATVVEKLIQHAANVELVRLKSSGRNALDFALTYYLGRAVLADPCGYFHIISKDTGYDALIEHLRTKHINVRRHDSFATLTFLGQAKPASLAPPATAPKPKLPSKPKAQSPVADNRLPLLLEHLRKSPATRPKNKDKLVSLLVAQLNHQINEAETIVGNLRQSGLITIGEKGVVTYHWERM